MSNRLNQERQAKLEPKRMELCRRKLESLGFVCQIFGGNRLEFMHEGHKITFWPYSGWHTGRTIKDGRGFDKLLEQLNPTGETES